MTRIDWAGLMRLGLVGLRLAPDVFWALTPGELLLIAGLGAAPGAMNRARLAAILERFPDREPTIAERR
jgi:uncharacterized phage protein (TIGR02216 family)